jgi:ABC-type glycerol-3-phosphate transport system permease component
VILIPVYLIISTMDLPNSVSGIASYLSVSLIDAMIVLVVIYFNGRIAKGFARMFGSTRSEKSNEMMERTYTVHKFE